MLKIRTDEGVMTLNFNPTEHKTAEAAAKALHAALIPHVELRGQNPSIELSIHSPNETPEYCPTGDKSWWVIWEAGPYDWGVIASFDAHGPSWWTEPYWGFDLLFIEDK